VDELETLILLEGFRFRFFLQLCRKSTVRLLVQVEDGEKAPGGGGWLDTRGLFSLLLQALESEEDPEVPSPPEALCGGISKVNSSETLSIFGDKCPQNGSKNEQRAPRTSMGCPHIGPSVDPQHTSICIYPSICLHIYLSIYIHLSIYLYMYISIYVYMYHTHLESIISCSRGPCT
jgi:hypothetical protein